MSKSYLLNWKQWKESKFGCKGKQEFGFYVEVLTLYLTHMSVVLNLFDIFFPSFTVFLSITQ